MLLNSHTYYSLNYGVLDTEEQLRIAQEYGYDCYALTDINNTSACLDFIRLAPKYKIRPVVGIDFRNGVEQKFVGIAQSNQGFEALNTYLSQHLHEKKEFPDLAPELPDVHFIYPYPQYKGHELSDKEWIGVSPQYLSRLTFSKWQKYQNRMVAFPSATFIKKQHFTAHKLLRAIDLNILISRLEKHHQASTHDVFPRLSQLEERYKDYPQLLYNCQKILNESENSFVFKDPFHHENKRFLNSNAQEDRKQLLQLIDDGLNYRYGQNIPPEVPTRVEKELDIITQKGFIGYFLMNWKIVDYARHKDYYYVGRGSGANSLIAYLLRITDVDPIELDLYFERFMNIYRQNPPDFDIDFSWKDRDDVTEFIFKEFPKSALVGTYNTYKRRAVLRELGKVFGLPKHEQDILKKENGNYTNLDQASQKVLSYAKLIHEFPSHLSIHASGILIPEKNIYHFGGTFLPPKNFPTTQFSMIEAEDVGLFKFDILSQRGLGKIKDSLELIKQNQPNNPPKNIRNINAFKKDPKVNSLLKNGKAIGCFYVESPAMRMLLSKLSVDTYLGLVAASSIIRPGVAKSGMMREYILRHHGLPAAKELPPKMLEIMPETYGVMVYQEDVIKVAHIFAGLSLAESDELRRGMSGKYRSREEFLKVQERFFSNCKKKAYPIKTTEEIWKQIESFAGYAFSKGHSASYAVESYQCLYLKAYYPLEYMVATINNSGGFYRSETYIHEARMLGANIHAPCINKSSALSIIEGKDIYLGLHYIKGIESQTMQWIQEEKAKNGPFQSFEDFSDRINVGLEQTALLIRANVFRFSGVHKRELLWKAHYSISKEKKKNLNLKMFSTLRKDVSVPELEYEENEESYDQMELLGFPLCNPFDLVKEKSYKKYLAKDFKDLLHQTIEIRGYLVSIKKTATTKGDRMNFGTFLDEEGHFFDTTHFPISAKQFPFRGIGIYQVKGKVVEEFGFYSLEVCAMEKLAYDTEEMYD
jgi:DNA polymerase-3 subunit alpha